MIIGIDGYAGAGKDTIADLLVKRGFTKLSFADALRESVVHATGFSLNTFLDRDIKDRKFGETYTLSTTVLTKFCHYLGYPDKTQDVIDQFSGTLIDSPRHLLQFLGTEVGRSALSPTIWLDKYDEKRAGLGLVVTPDARFSNEREHIQSIPGGQVWLVKRAGTEPTGKHISELDKWEESKYDVVVNNVDLMQLKYDVGMWWSLKGSRLR
jgi:hypothetical protein